MPACDHLRAMARAGMFGTFVLFVVAGIALFAFTNSNIQELEGRAELRRWIQERRLETEGAEAQGLSDQARCLNYVSRIGLSVGDDACAEAHPCRAARRSFLARWFPGEGFERDCAQEKPDSSVWDALLSVWNSVAWSSAALATAITVLSGVFGGFIVSSGGFIVELLRREGHTGEGTWGYLQRGFVGSLVGGLAAAVVFWVLRAGVGAISVEGEASSVANAPLLALVGLAAGVHAPKLEKRLVSFTTWIWEGFWSSPDRGKGEDD